MSERTRTSRSRVRSRRRARRSGTRRVDPGVGCGNGRDALHFARSGFRVFASDPSHSALAEARSRMDRGVFAYRPQPIARAMDDLDDRHAGELDAVYARFVLHAVTGEVASAGLRWAARNLRPGGRLFVEVRSVLGSLYGKGRPAGRDAYIHDGHYRRFIRADELRAELLGIGFRIDDLVEAAGMAVHDDDDPVVIRVFASREQVGPS